MIKIIDRPKMNASPRAGLLCGEHIQVAYVTSYIERACTIFSERFGVKDYATIESELPAGGKLRVKLAWTGGTMLELIEASGNGTAFYTERLPSDRFSIQFHHLAYLLEDAAAWQELEEQIVTQKRSVPFRGVTPGFMRFCYVHAEELGHYLEYFLLGPEGVAFFESIPAT